MRLKLSAILVIALLTVSVLFVGKNLIHEISGKSIRNSEHPPTQGWAPRTFLINSSKLGHLKAILNSLDNNTSLGNSSKEIIKQADLILLAKAHSVVEKKQLPPSGDKHDFFALAPYHWPNPAEPQMMPYIWHDGVVNPEINSIPDKLYFDNMIDMVTILSISYYLTDDSKYASKATELLRTWFLNDGTRMNPNLNFGEVIRGKDKIHSAGIMAGSNLTKLIDAVGMIENSDLWTTEDRRGLQEWFTEYFDWLLNSESGKEESVKLNNHGTYYYLQISTIGLFLNKTEVVKDALQKVLASMPKKILPDGRQPLELRRTRALYYSGFNLLGLFKLADIGNQVGVDLWNYKSSEGAGLEPAYRFFNSTMTSPLSTFPQIVPLQRSLLLDLSCHAKQHFHLLNDSLIYPTKSVPGPMLKVFELTC